VVRSQTETYWVFSALAEAHLSEQRIQLACGYLSKPLKVVTKQHSQSVIPNPLSPSRKSHG